jgi:hypothetical protein
MMRRIFSLMIFLVIIFGLNILICLYANNVLADPVDIVSHLTAEVYDDKTFGLSITSRNILSAYYLNESFSAYGFVKFDLSALPDNAIITELRLTTYHFLNVGYYPNSPYNNPIVDVLYSSDDSWMRNGTTDLSMIQNVVSSGNTGFPNTNQSPYNWNLDINSHNWAEDLYDNTLTLVLKPAKSEYSFVYFYGSGETDPSKIVYDPNGNFAPVLHVEYVPIPEPSTMLFLGSGLLGLAGLRKKFKK